MFSKDTGMQVANKTDLLKAIEDIFVLLQVTHTGDQTQGLMYAIIHQ